MRATPSRSRNPLPSQTSSRKRQQPRSQRRRPRPSHGLTDALALFDHPAAQGPSWLSTTLRASAGMLRLLAASRARPRPGGSRRRSRRHHTARRARARLRGRRERRSMRDARPAERAHVGEQPVATRPVGVHHERPSGRVRSSSGRIPTEGDLLAVR